MRGSKVKKALNQKLMDKLEVIIKDCNEASGCTTQAATSIKEVA